MEGFDDSEDEEEEEIGEKGGKENKKGKQKVKAEKKELEDSDTDEGATAESMDAFCSVCHELFESPVKTPCGHVFCQVWLATPSNVVTFVDNVTKRISPS